MYDYSQLLGFPVMCAPKQFFISQAGAAWLFPASPLTWLGWTVGNLSAGACTTWIMGFTPSLWPHLNGEKDDNP